MLNTTHEEFVREYSRHVRAGDAALFAGAGLSRPAGYVDWRGLLQEIAKDLDLDVKRESDLIAIAQYHFNRKHNRHKLNEALIHEFTKTAKLSENHRIIARIPISTIWTTNYDTLLEDEIRAAGKIPDVKITHENLTYKIPNCDVAIYKMHGDISQPQDAVLTKDDYEEYEQKRRLFVENFKGDLVSKTFLFLGFSFTDPNIDYVLRRIRVLLGENKRNHYCIMRKPQRSRKAGGKEEFKYQMRRLYLRIDDLQRYGIQTVLIDNFSEITGLLNMISKRVHQKNIFVSGSAHQFGSFGRAKMQDFAKGIGAEIIKQDYNLVSGFGLGLGEQVVLGALKALYDVEKGRELGRTIIKPFPRVDGKRTSQAKVNSNHRKNLISQCRVAVFICGNRKETNGKTSISQGVLEEYNICKDLGRFPIPVGSTGFAAGEIMKDVKKTYKDVISELHLKKLFRVLEDGKKSNKELLDAVIAIADTVTSRES